MKKLFFLAAAFAAMTFTSCSQSDNPILLDDETVKIDERINTVIPEELRAQIEEQLPIYDGVNPPNVEGVYYIKPMITSYDSYNSYAPGYEIIPMHIMIKNQDMVKNTVDYEGNEDNVETYTGNGAFISGYDDNFTVYFDLDGVVSGVPVKEALVISGTKSDEGIKNLYYAFIVTEKGDDPGNDVVPEGTYRVFYDSDGLSVKTTWPYGARQLDMNAIVEKFGTVPTLHSVK